MGLIVPTLPFKVDFTRCEDWSELAVRPFTRAQHLVIVDQSALPDPDDDAGPENLSKNVVFKRAAWILLRSRDVPDEIGGRGFDALYTKPFLPEELVEIILRHTKIL